MLLKTRLFALWILLTLTISFGTPVTSSAALSCGSFLKKAASSKSIGYYLNSVALIPRFEPKFLDPEAEAKMAENWKGTQEGPLLLAQTLHENTAFIDRPLLAADAGTVKSATAAGYVSMRLRHQWNGKDMSTNLGVSADSLVAKTIEGSGKLVPKSAKAVFLFMHGWGTKTTGHHVAAAFSNFLAAYGIVVLSIDAPHHAYGPRVSELSPKEYATYLRDFKKEFVPEGVPTFIGGHSGGGFIADMMMRFSDDPELGLRDAFAGAINLSGPMDAAPGKSFAEKNAAEERINSNTELMDLVPKAERDLSVLLLTQGKASATSGLSAETFMSSVDWKKPDHKGDDYLPTLVVMGERDGLYVGREQIFKDYLADLSNTETHVMGLRPNFKGDDAWVSHMIFDHYIPGTKAPETFNLVKDFIGKQIGDELPKSKGSSLIADSSGSKIGIILNIVQEYYNNIAFRKFAEEFSITVKTASPEAQALGARSGRIVKIRKRIQKQIKSAQQRGDHQRAERLQIRDETIGKELAKTKALMTLKFIPEGEHKAFAEDNVGKRDGLEEQIHAALKTKQTSVKDLRTLRDEVQKKQKTFDELIESALWKETVKTPEAIAVQKKIEERLQEMIALQVKMNEANSALVARNKEKGVFAVNPGPEELAVYQDLDAAYAAYNEAMAEGRQVIATAIGKGATDKDDLSAFNHLYGSLEAFASGTPSKESLLGRLNSTNENFQAAEADFNRLSEERDLLAQEYAERVVPGLYTFTTTRLFDEINKPLSTLMESSSGLETLWKVWSEIWKERPPEQGTSLY